MTLTLTHKEWNRIFKKIREEHGLDAVLSWRLKEAYGFTVRSHSGTDYLTNQYVNDIRLDFVNEASATFFRLKYL